MLFLYCSFCGAFIWRDITHEWHSVNAIGATAKNFLMISIIDDEWIVCSTVDGYVAGPAVRYDTIDTTMG